MNSISVGQLCNGGGINGNNLTSSGGGDAEPPVIKIEHYEPLSTRIDEEEPSCSSSSPKVDSNEDESGESILPEIGSKNSAFLPYKQQSLTVLTNLQRGNVQTHMRDALPEPLTFHERAAKGELEPTNITDINVNSLDEHGLPALHWACYHGRLTMVQMLIEKGALVNAQALGGETALMFAATNGHLEILTFLLSNGASVDLADEHGNTALMYATVGNYTRCVSELLNHGASLTKCNEFDDTPFSVAVAKNLQASQNAMEQYLKDLIETRMVQHNS